MKRGLKLNLRQSLMPKMPVKDSIKMSFWQKFIKYRRFPFKFVTHLLLVVFVTVQVFLFAREREDYLFSAGDTIINSFLPEGFQNSQESKNGYATYEFFKMEDVVAHIDETVKNYYEFANQSMDYFVYHPADALDAMHYNSAGHFQFEPDRNVQLLLQMASGASHFQHNASSYTIKPIRMLNTLYRTLDLDIKMDFSKPLNKETREEQYYLTPTFPSPFTDASIPVLRSYFHNLLEMRLDFGFRTIFIKREYPEILLWAVSLTYDFQDRGGRVPLLAKFDVSLCPTNQHRITFANVVLSPITWVCLIVVFLSIVSLLLVLRAMIRSCRLIRKSKKDAELKYYTTYGSFPDEGLLLAGANSGGQDSQTPTTPGDHQSEISIPMSGVESNPTLKQRMRFFNVWHLLTMVGNVIGVVSSLFALSNISYRYADLKAANIMLGISAIFAWSNIVQYFAHNPKFYILITSLRNGLPNVIRFIIGALPIFIGYGMCGMLLFGSYSKYFQGLQNSMVTLFSAANGDALHDTFDTIYGQNRFLAYLSRIYMVSFVCLFTYCVLNIFILIMEDAYFTVREAGLTQALQQEFQQNVESVVEHKIEEYEEARSDSSESDISILLNKNDLAYGSDDEFWSESNYQERKAMKKKRKLLKLLNKFLSGKYGDKMDDNQRKVTEQLIQQIKNPVAVGHKSSNRPIPKLSSGGRVSFNKDSLESATVRMSSPTSTKVRSHSMGTPTRSILKDRSINSPISRDDEEM